MNILAIETTSAFASVAVIKEDGQCAEVVADGSLTHLQKLMPMVDDVLKKSGLSLNQLTGLAVSRGPGSFTGIRIGMSTAKAIAQVHHIPIAQVPTLFAMASTMKSCQGAICPILDARRNQVYAAGYLFEDGQQKQIFSEGAYFLEEVVSFLESYDNIHFMGDGVLAFQEILIERLGQKAKFVLLEERMRRASAVAEIGLSMHLMGQTVNYIEAEPEYLRKSEAERNLELKKRQEKPR